MEDVDGNRLVDLHNAWGSVILGHGAPEVEEAVLRVLRDGGAALSTRYEASVTERLIALRGWSETVRFAKTGSDAIAVAIRLALPIRCATSWRCQGTPVGTTRSPAPCRGSGASRRPCAGFASASTAQTPRHSRRSSHDIRTGSPPRSWSLLGRGRPVPASSTRSAGSRSATAWSSSTTSSRAACGRLACSCSASSQRTWLCSARVSPTAFRSRPCSALAASSGRPAPTSCCSLPAPTTPYRWRRRRPSWRGSPSPR